MKISKFLKDNNWLISLILAVAAIVVAVIVAIGLDTKPRVLGEFSTRDTDTTVLKAGECTVFVTKWKGQPEAGHESPKENFFFACPNSK